MDWMRTIFSLLRFPILVFVVNAVLDARGIYVAFPWVDMPMHFLGGVSIAVAGISFLAFLSRSAGSLIGRKTQGFINELPFLVRTLFIMSFVGLAALAWEVWEFALNIQVDLPDTMVDMFFGLLGGTAMLLLREFWTVFRIDRRL